MTDPRSDATPAPVGGDATAVGATWRRRPELPFQIVEQDVLVVDPATRAVHLFNKTAARIWTLLSAPRSVDELVAALADEYEADAADLRAEVTSFINDMTDKGLCARAAALALPAPAK